MNMEDYPAIIEKARELSGLLKAHPATVRYMESTEKMKNDRNAQALLEKLVMLGRDIDALQQGASTDGPGEAERILIEKELEDNPLVKEHILAQKEYLILIQQMQECIRNPEGHPYTAPEQ